MKKYDAIIIGSGQGGNPLAKKLAEAGWRTALVEKQYAGGTCVNVGCTPTKAMIASAKAAYIAANSGDWGVEIPEFKVNISKVINRKDKIVESFRSGSQTSLEKTNNLDFIFGLASFKDQTKIHIQLNDGGTEEISAPKIFIDAGGRPAIPEIDGLQDCPYFTSTSMMELKEIPEHLLIIGGGYIGLEFGQMYRRFGSKVTILEHSERFLEKEDKDISEEISKILEGEKIKILTNVKVENIRKSNDHLTISFSIAKENKTIDCSHILLAAGRTPNTDLLNTKSAGIELDDRGHIVVNDKLETTAEGIYAIGDIKGGPEFTHISYNDFVILSGNLLNGKHQSIKDRIVPYTMFTDPQLGRIGITEQEARKKDLNIQVLKIPMEKVARAIETGDTRGLMKVIVDAKSGEILGAAVLGSEGGELMTLIQMAMLGKIKAPQLKYMIFAHPLYAESLNNLFSLFEED